MRVGGVCEYFTHSQESEYFICREFLHGLRARVCESDPAVTEVLEEEDEEEEVVYKAV